MGQDILSMFVLLILGSKKIKTKFSWGVREREGEFKKHEGYL
jgi:hypothetical protein